MGKDIFISHAWGPDDNLRDNHNRVKELYNILTQKGYTVWIDTNDLYGNIDSSIINGINSASVILLCLTKRYFEKINNAVHGQILNDACYKEWNYSLFKQKKIIPIIMDQTSSDIYLNQDGIIQMYLNNCLYINYIKSFENESDINLLYKTLYKYEIFNNEEKKLLGIKPNNSFDNLVSLFNERIKSMSPRKKNNISKGKNSPNDSQNDSPNDSQNDSQNGSPNSSSNSSPNDSLKLSPKSFKHDSFNNSLNNSLNNSDNFKKLCKKNKSLYHKFNVIFKFCPKSNTPKFKLRVKV